VDSGEDVGGSMNDVETLCPMLLDNFYTRTQTKDPVNKVHNMLYI